MFASPPENIASVLKLYLNALPGLALCALLVAAGVLMAQLLPAFSFVIWAVILGALVANTVGVSRRFKPGVHVAIRPLLRLAVVLLGFQIPLADILGINWQSIVVIVTGCILTFVIIKALARPLGVDEKLGELIAAGTAICGASAIMAINTVTRADKQDAVYAISSVTVLGSIAMLLLPAIAIGMDLTPSMFALWAGASIHEIGQVAGAATQFGGGSEELAMTAKLIRVMMLSPLAFALALLARKRGATPGDEPAVPLVPGFALGFFVAVAIANVAHLPPELTDATRIASMVLLALALAGLGLSLQIGKLARKGIRPALLAFIGTTFLLLFSIAALHIAS